MSTFAAAEALRIVLREEQPGAMADVLLDMERARMTAEDVRGEERLREATARTRGAIDAVIDEINGYRPGTPNGVSILQIASNDFFAVSRTVL